MARSPDEIMNDIERRVANVVHFGTVEAADYARARIRVRVGPNVTTWVPWTTSRAGGDRSWHPPEIGEQVVLAAPCGDLNQAVVLGSVYQAKHSAPADKPTVAKTVWEDGASVTYDREASHYTMHVPERGQIALRIGQSTVEMVKDRVLLTCGRSTLEMTPDGIKLNATRIDLN